MHYLTTLIQEPGLQLTIYIVEEVIIFEERNV